ncbi:MAG: DUF58 domain-containing protein [Chitinophagales bacterium]|jgi:uncharacterized protein (DUF58 family)|nr:DUF58 domain-containing protein [Chitinophagales bacterium]
MVKQIYLGKRFFISGLLLVGIFIWAFSHPHWLDIAKLCLLAWVLLIFVDMLLLFRWQKGITANRRTTERLSNGDANTVTIDVENRYPFDIAINIIDELPAQLQIRNFLLTDHLASQAYHQLTYTIRPTERGEYFFGSLHIFVSSPLGIVQRRYSLMGKESMLAVYPSFIQMQKYELLAFSNQIQAFGIKKMRRIGHSMEFEQIKNYVVGDDYRHVNWKATARQNELMVNQYQDEKSQQIYCVIDKGRTMKMPFDGLTLLDYAINSTLVMSNIVLKKGDKAGLLTFAEQPHSFLKASKQASQMRHIQELLYREQTNFMESDYEKLYSLIRRQITQRSLILLFSNFETLSGMQRQLPFLLNIARRHLLVVIFFENTALHTLLQQKTDNIQKVYEKTIAEKFAYEKQLIIKELHIYGIQTIFTQPQDLSINTINKYLELKARGRI